jgi:hypothetical protein
MHRRADIDGRLAEADIGCMRFSLTRTPVPCRPFSTLVATEQTPSNQRWMCDVGDG